MSGGRTLFRVSPIRVRVKMKAGVSTWNSSIRLGTPSLGWVRTSLTMRRLSCHRGRSSRPWLRSKGRSKQFIRRPLLKLKSASPSCWRERPWRLERRSRGKRSLASIKRLRSPGFYSPGSRKRGSRSWSRLAWICGLTMMSRPPISMTKSLSWWKRLWLLRSSWKPRDQSLVRWRGRKIRARSAAEVHFHTLTIMITMSACTNYML